MKQVSSAFRRGRFKTVWEFFQIWRFITLDPTKFSGKLVKEKNPGGETEYFHLYEGKIPLTAVVAVNEWQEPNATTVQIDQKVDRLSLALAGYQTTGDVYVTERPGYPQEAVDLLVRSVGMGPDKRVLAQASSQSVWSPWVLKLWLWSL